MDHQSNSIWQDGYDAGLRDVAEESKNPYDLYSMYYATWEDGYTAGWIDRLMERAKAEEWKKGQ